MTCNPIYRLNTLGVCDRSARSSRWYTHTHCSWYWWVQSLHLSILHSRCQQVSLSHYLVKITVNQPSLYPMMYIVNPRGIIYGCIEGPIGSHYNPLATTGGRQRLASHSKLVVKFYLKLSHERGDPWFQQFLSRRPGSTKPRRAVQGASLFQYARHWASARIVAKVGLWQQY